MSASRNLYKNTDGLSDVAVYPYALAASNGSITMSDNRGSSSFIKKAKGNIVDVKKVRASDVFPSGEIDVLKIDVEGAETEIIRDLDVSGRLKDVKRIVGEFHFLYPENDFGEFVFILKKNNFKISVYSMDVTPEKIVSERNGSWHTHFYAEKSE